MQNAVVGFLFDETRDRILLQCKDRPDWQKGRYNGPGGKVNGREPAVEAVRREVREETGLDVPEDAWELFCVTEGAGFRVHHFTTATDIRKARTVDPTEPILSMKWDTALIMPDLLPDLRWLIPLALDDNIVRPVTLRDGTRRPNDHNPAFFKTAFLHA